MDYASCSFRANCKSVGEYCRRIENECNDLHAMKIITPHQCGVISVSASGMPMGQSSSADLGVQLKAINRQSADRRLLFADRFSEPET